MTYGTLRSSLWLPIPALTIQLIHVFIESVWLICVYDLLLFTGHWHSWWWPPGQWPRVSVHWSLTTNIVSQHLGPVHIQESRPRNHPCLTQNSLTVPAGVLNGSTYMWAVSSSQRAQRKMDAAVTCNFTLLFMGHSHSSCMGNNV